VKALLAGYREVIAFWGQAVPRLADPVLSVPLLVLAALAWNGNPALLPLSYLFPAVWAATGQRGRAFLLALLYHALAARGLAAGAATYFHAHICCCGTAAPGGASCVCRSSCCWGPCRRLASLAGLTR
jgi:hypothetical protein